jgi:hypothetical protein
MKYEIDKVGEPGRLYIEEEDLLGVRPCRDGTHAVEIDVRYRKQYQAEDVFEWQGTGKNLKLRLVTRQAMDIVEQERTVQTAFCTDCFDYGKAEAAPKDCLRCQLLDACRKAGHGDHRKIRPAPKEAGPGLGYGTAMILLLLIWWWTLCQWANAASQTSQLQRQLVGCSQKTVMQ